MILVFWQSHDADLLMILVFWQPRDADLRNEVNGILGDEIKVGRRKVVLALYCSSHRAILVA